ncbi:carbohydrate ABC transporter permease [Bauldia sp.]|uniref:carbohydrate ABC transporter permease n=1 Tax=Bauldia sp. TaxID=2575872 RepID=UPI003BA8AF60
MNADAYPIRRLRPRRIAPWQFVAGAIVLFAMCFFGLPLIWLFLAASQTDASLFSAPPFSWGGWDNVVATWTNLVTYEGAHLRVWIVNSIIYSVGGVGLSLVAALPAGYALATYDFPGRRAILIVTLVAMITPNAAVVLPIFLEMNLIGLNNTRISLVLATAFFPFGVYLAFIYFATALPRDVLNSARVDGATPWQVFRRIALPLAKPVISLIAFFSFIANWANYFLAFVLLSDDDLYNLPVGLTALISGSRALSFSAATGIPIRRPEAIQAAILVVLPVLVIFLFSQRFIRSGQLAGSEKG